jgi:signal peptidase
MTAIRWTRRILDALLVVAILAVVLAAGTTLLAPVLGGRALVVGGASMEPTIPRGSLVLVTPAGPEGYRLGDVVTVQQGASTPYTHRISRLTELRGLPYVETRGDANAQPDPAIVPITAIVGRAAYSLPFLGYLSLILGTATGLAGFLALCATILILVWVLEDLELDRCAECAAARAAAAREPVAVGGPPAGTASAAGVLAALPPFAAASPPTRVRETGSARDPRTPVLPESLRRTPHLSDARATAQAATPADAPRATGAPQPSSGADPEMGGRPGDAAA